MLKVKHDVSHFRVPAVKMCNELFFISKDLKCLVRKLGERSPLFLECLLYFMQKDIFLGKKKSMNQAHALHAFASA